MTCDHKYKKLGRKKRWRNIHGERYYDQKFICEKCCDIKEKRWKK